MPQPLPTSPAAERNKGPILEVLQALLPPEATVLEVASGTGQHAAHFAASQPRWRWQPSDGDVAALPVIAERCARLPNVATPRHLDLRAPHGDAAAAGVPAACDAAEAHVDTSPGARFDAVFAANLMHISPWPTCAALMRLAVAHLRAGGVLVVYGPFEVEGEPLAPSNRAFDADLRARDPRWGLRRLGDVQAEATRAGLVFERRVAMPANNLVLVWRRAAEGEKQAP
ncbi:MAG: DUF938 domain-containing protein [Rubrivivax sp.]|nr:DUF938 domain-containing protein [Rubrivivax sp.]